MKMKMRIIALVTTVFIFSACAAHEQITLLDWDLQAVGYSSQWCAELKNNTDFALGIVDINTTAYTDKKEPGIQHTEAIKFIVAKLAPSCFIKVVELDKDASDLEINNAILQLYNDHIHVINISFGKSEKVEFSEEVCSYLEDGTLILVCASGNQWEGVLYPAASDYTINVYAKDINGGIAKYNLEENKQGFSAPGFHIYIGEDTYSGSSLSTVYVSVAFAALHAKYPVKTRDQLIDIAKQHTINATSNNDWGIIQLENLLK